MSTHLSDKALTICARHWRTKPDGTLAANCCEGCPLVSTCSAPLSGPLSAASIARHAAVLNHAAELVA